MARLQSFKRIIVEDFEEKYKDLISKLGYSVNSFADDVLNALNKNISVSDNLNINKKTIIITVDPTGKPVSNPKITTGLNAICTGISVIRAVNNTNSTITPTQCPFITFSDDGGQLTIQKITGLTPNQQYSLNIILWV